MRNKTSSRLPSLLLVILLLFSLALPARAADKEEEETEPEYRLTVHLRTAEDVLELGDNCSLDAWSRDVLVILENDISLAGIDYTPIPSFGGTLEGGSHTISSLEILGSHAPAGLFARIQSGGVVRDLRVEGSVLPGGDGTLAGGIVGINSGRVENCSFTGSVSAAARVGGIAGRNTMTGVITGCSVSGGVFGKDMTGGVAGENLGTVENCRNDSYVNIQSVDPALSADMLSISDIRDLLALASPDTLNLTSDTGGIVGYSSGTVTDCRNRGAVGYQHLGYNVGGVVGRSCGYIAGCANDGAVYGRKEVGGIVGQAEPYVESTVTEDLLATLSGEMGGLNSLINNAIRDTDDTMDDLAGAFISMAGIIKPIRDAIGNVSDFSDLDALRSLMNQVSGALSSLQGQISAISGKMHQVSDTLSDDFRRINNQISAISGTTIDAMSAISGNSLTDIVTDASQVDIDAVTQGKVFGCGNSGSVYGDINVGGVAGAMAIEQALDPEGDLQVGVSSTIRTEYQLKAILQQCESTGEIRSKKDGAGAVCGRMELGLIYQCRGQGSAESESGSYVGGIVGHAYGTVRSCQAKCTLRGGSYVGGIIGCGDTDSLSGISSEVVDCVSMVEIPRWEQYAGAIAGLETGAFSGNCFVSDTLSGINTLSYEGMAEPLSYKELLVREDLPDMFRSFTLSFRADGKDIKTLYFDYGSSFGANAFPPIPEKDGFYGVWDRKELKDLHFDTVVTAEYLPRITALPSRETADDGRPAFLAEGQFRDGDALTVEFLDPASLSMDSFSQGGWELIRSQFSALFRGERPDSSIARAVTDLWTLDIPEDGLTEHTIRYRPPDGNTDNLRLYVDEGDGWKIVTARAVGSYLLFDTNAEHLRGAAVSTIRTLWLALGAVVAVLLAAGLVILWIRLRKKWKSAPKKDRPSLREKLDPALTPAQKKKWRRIVLAMIAVLLVGGGAAGWILRSTGVHREWEIYSQLRQLSSREELDMDAHIRLIDGESVTELDVPVCRLRVDKTFVTRLELEGVPVYSCGGVLYLENGRAFAAAGTAPEGFLSDALEAFRSSSITAEMREDRTLFRISLPAEEAGALATIFYPLSDDLLPDDAPVIVTITQMNGAITALDLILGAAQEASCHLDVRPDAEGHVLPQAVRDAVLSGSGVPDRLLTGDVLWLLSAWRELEGRKAMAADVRLFADCGSVLLDETLTYVRSEEDGTRIRGVIQDPLAVYFTDEAVCSPDGSLIFDSRESLLRREDLWELTEELIENSDLSCTVSGTRRIYTLSLDEEAMREAAAAIAPRTEALDLNLRGGTLRVTVIGRRLTGVEISCSGSVRVVLSDVDAALSAQFRIRDRANVTIPDPVIRTLTGSEGGTP